MLKVVIRKSIDAPGSVFDTQKFLKKYTCENFKEYYDIVKWSVNEKKKSLQYSNEDYAAMKYRAKIIGAHPYNRCEVYDRCNRILSPINKKVDRKYDRRAGAILGRNLKANYWEEMSKIRKNQSERSIANWEFLFHHECIRREKIEKNVYGKNKLMKWNLVKSRRIIAETLSTKINQAVEARKEIIQENWNRLVSGEVKKCFSVVKLKVMLGNIWSEAINGVSRKIVGFVRDKLEREREEIHNRKVKRLRQKWKTLMKKNKLKEAIKDIKKARMKDVWTKT
jgi:hypothetical protein